MSLPVPYHPTFEIKDSSKLQTFSDCPRRYFYEYVLGWRSEVPNNHLYFGESVHKALEVLHSEGFDVPTIAKAFQSFVEHYRQQFGVETDALYWPKVPANVIQILTQYASKYRADLSRYTVLYTEVAGTVPVSDTEVMHFRLDTILRENTGDQMVVILEHKTGSSTYMWDKQWGLKIQPGTYTHVANCVYGPEQVRGVLMNGLFFKKNKTNPVDLLRVPVWRTQEHMRTWLWTVNDLIERIKYEFDRLSFAKEDDPVLRCFPMNGEACTKYTGCPYHDFCSTWANPLRKCHTPPLGFIQEWWDPSAYQAKTTMNVGK